MPHDRRGTRWKGAEKGVLPSDTSSQNEEDNLVRLFPSVARVEADHPSSNRQLTAITDYLDPDCIFIRYEVEVTVDHKSEG